MLSVSQIKIGKNKIGLVGLEKSLKDFIRQAQLQLNKQP
jgi:hypothetical protein